MTSKQPEILFGLVSTFKRIKGGRERWDIWERGLGDNMEENLELLCWFVNFKLQFWLPTCRQLILTSPNFHDE